MNNDTLMSPNEFIGEVISIVRMDKLHFDIDPTEILDRRVRVYFGGALPLPTGEEDYVFFDGYGPTMGHALRKVREELREKSGK